ncbi:MAG: biopolymer transport protein ExbD [Planctomycetota bacterium]|jgi:biopolymer transport protein ExbD
MSSKLKELSEEKVELEMTPMIDVTFLLLIFFMCTLKFKTLEGKLAAYLPKDVGVNQMDAEPIEKVEILMRVVEPGTKYKDLGDDKLGPYNGVGRFVYGNDRVVQYSVGIKKTTKLSEIETKLKSIREKEPDRPATIDARPGTVYGDVIKVLDVALSAEFTDITFVGAYPDSIK